MSDGMLGEDCSRNGTLVNKKLVRGAAWLLKKPPLTDLTGSIRIVRYTVVL